LILFPLSYLWLYELSSSGVEAGHEIWFNSLVQFQFFALGALLALVLRGRVLTLRLWARIGVFVAGLTSWLIADGVFHIDDPGPRHSPGSIVIGYAFVGLGCLLFLASFLGLSPRLLPKTLVHFGKISYGLYVFHMLSLCVCWKLFWPAEAPTSLPRTTAGAVLLGGRAVVILLVGMAMTIMLAELSYRFLERPFLRMKERFAFISSRAV
jgi:peptidoglycan/LPS O-acetylase OafA/YrhL